MLKIKKEKNLIKFCIHHLFLQMMNSKKGVSNAGVIFLMKSLKYELQTELNTIITYTIYKYPITNSSTNCRIFRQFFDNYTTTLKILFRIINKQQ